MSLKVAGGVEEAGIVIGNTYDKYGSRNPIVRRIMAGFESALGQMVEKVAPASIHEVGCGEGYWVMRWQSLGIPARGSDFSAQVVEIARHNAARQGQQDVGFQQRSIYDLRDPEDSADLVVCCEVLEHLGEPEAGLRALQRVVDGHLILSVPREPIWRLLNLVRGKYVSDLGNTPGHIQHWSRRAFIAMVSEYFEVIDVKTPLPWVMLLCRPYK